MSGLSNYYIDLGANQGDTIRTFALENPDYFLIGVEANPSLIPNILEKNTEFADRLTLIQAAAWSSATVLDFYLGHHESSTLIAGKTYAHRGVPIDYDHPVKMPTLRVSNLIAMLVGRGRIVVKMDIEGAEYEVLNDLCDTGAIKHVSELRVEWHLGRFPSVTQELHDRVAGRLLNYPGLRIENWT